MKTLKITKLFAAVLTLTVLTGLLAGCVDRYSLSQHGRIETVEGGVLNHNRKNYDDPLRTAYTPFVTKNRID